MMRSRSVQGLVLLAALAAAGASQAVPRTFVASYGTDANAASNCGPTAPCRSFNSALSVTSPGGELIVVDSAGYGPAPVNITQSVSIIVPDGVYAGIAVPPGVDGIDVNGAGIDVVLRGLAINSESPAGTNRGIYMSNGARLTIEGCAVTGFGSPAAGYSDTTGAGIHINTQASVLIKDTIVRNSNWGLRFGGGALATLVRVMAIGNREGIAAAGSAADTMNTVVTVSDSLSSNNAGAGYWSAGTVFCTTCSSMLVLRRVESALNGWGIYTEPGGTVYVSASHSTTDTDCGLCNFGGTLNSSNDNVVDNTSVLTTGTITNVAGSNTF